MQTVPLLPGIMSNYQGGKEWGLKLKQREDELDDINKQFLSSGNYDHVRFLDYF